MICMKLSTLASSSFLYVCSLERNAGKVYGQLKPFRATSSKKHVAQPFELLQILLNILNHFTSRRIICTLSAAATSRAQPNYSHLNYYDGSSTFVRVLALEQTNKTTQGRQRRETEMEKLREEDRKAGLKEGMKITQLLIIKRKANRAEHFTCSTKILAWSAQPSKRT